MIKITHYNLDATSMFVDYGDSEVNTIASVLYHIPLERAGHPYFDNVCEICIYSLQVEIKEDCAWKSGWAMI